MQRLILSTGVFIRNYLLEHKEAYILEIYRAFKKEKKGFTNWRNRPLKTGSYQSFRNYIWWLRKLGLIEFSSKKHSESPFLKPRRYYRLTMLGREKLELFINPRRDLYPRSYQMNHPKSQSLGSSRRS